MTKIGIQLGQTTGNQQNQNSASHNYARTTEPTSNTQPYSNNHTGYTIRTTLASQS